jgi:hypothetical protein
MPTKTIQARGPSGETTATATAIGGTGTVDSVAITTSNGQTHTVALTYSSDEPLGDWQITIDGIDTVVPLTSGEMEYTLASGNVPTAEENGAAAAAAIEIDEAALADAVSAKVQGLTLTVQQQRVINGAKELAIYQGDDYVENPIRIDIDQSEMVDPQADLSAYKLVVSFENGDSTTGLRMEISGSAGSHYSHCNPADKFWTVCPGFVIVETHDIEPGDIVDI